MRLAQTIAELERTAAREVGRGSERLAVPAAGGLLAAARSLVAAPDAAVLTDAAGRSARAPIPIPSSGPPSPGRVAGGLE
jgi:D-glutamate cyclase